MSQEFHEVQNSVTTLERWPVSDSVESCAHKGHLLHDITGNWSRHLCCFGPVSERSLLVVDVSESWLEVAANNSRLSRHNVNYISADLAKDVNSQPCHWVIHTCCKHTKCAVSEMPLKSDLNLQRWLLQPLGMWNIQRIWKATAAGCCHIFEMPLLPLSLWSRFSLRGHHLLIILWSEQVYCCQLQERHGTVTF